MKAEALKAEIINLIKSKAGLIWLITNEEARAEILLLDVAYNIPCRPYIWTITKGIKSWRTADKPEYTSELSDPNKFLQSLEKLQAPALVIAEDFGKVLKDDIVLQRLLKDELRIQGGLTKEKRRTVVVVGTDLPPSMFGIWPLDLSLPDRDEMTDIFRTVVLPDLQKSSQEISNEETEAVIHAILGLEREMALIAIGKSWAKHKKLVPKELIDSKKALISQSGAISWYDPDPRGLSAIGGLNQLKEWLLARKAGFSKEARVYGLPTPKGVLLAGIPGTGKSLTAKAAASIWDLPLLRLDMSAIFSKYVGDSEKSIREAQKVAESVAPCVMWIDEIEKAFAGATGSSSDGGVAARVLGSFLTWLQENDKGVFVIATANDVLKLPPELTRAGRFDAIWWLDIPKPDEREAIFQVMVKKYSISPDVDISELVKCSDGYTGAEIEEAIRSALFEAFAETNGKERPATRHIKKALEGKVIQVAKSSRLDEARRWAVENALKANTEDKPEEGPVVRFAT